MSTTVFRIVTALALVGSFGAGVMGGATQSALAASTGANLSTSTMTVSPTGTLNPDSSASYQVTIANSGNADATGVTYTRYAGRKRNPLGHLPEHADSAELTCWALGNVGISVPAANGVLSNDSDPDGDSIRLTAADSTSVNGGTVYSRSRREAHVCPTCWFHRKRYVHVPPSATVERAPTPAKSRSPWAHRLVYQQ